MDDTLDIRGLAIRLIRKRWFIFIIAMVIAILFGGYKLWGGIRSRNQAALSNSTADDYAAQLQSYDDTLGAHNTTLSFYGDSLSALSEYLETSLYMNLNPFNHYKATGSMAIITDYKVFPENTLQEQNLLGSILDYYAQSVYDDSLADKFDTQLSLDVNPSYIFELISVMPNETSGTLSISVLGSDKDFCNQILSLIFDHLYELQPEAASQIYKHKLIKISSYCGTAVNDSISIRQSDIQAFVDDLTEKSISAEDNLLALKLPANTMLYSWGAIIKSSVLFGILGFVVGAIIALILLFFFDISSIYIQDENDIQKHFSLRVFGSYYPTAKRKQKGLFFRLLIKLNGNHPTPLETGMPMLAANVAALLAEKPNMRIMLCGMASYPTIADAFASLQPLLQNVAPKANITIQGYESITVSPEATISANEFDYVLLIEELYFASIPGMEKELQFFSDIKKEVLGVLLVY